MPHKVFRAIHKKVAPLFVSRRVKNGAEILRWARSAGLDPNVPEDDLHVTIAFSRVPFDWFSIGDSFRQEVTIEEGGPRSVEQFGSAIVLRVSEDELEWRHWEFIDAGASWDWPEFKPHVTIRTDAPMGTDLSGVEAFQGEILLGPEIFEDIDPELLEKSGRMLGMADGIRSLTSGSITKVSDDDMRIAWGWFSVIEEGGVPVVDAQDDVIGETTLVKAVHEFVLDSRAGKLMHKGRRVADIVESVVFTRDVQNALGIDLGKVGWFGAMKFRDDEVWAKVKSGELRAFSIGGVGQRRMV